jgi:NAD(P)-dependent dehydrogenase (short-subunit alcohol dehydrogenase family)
MQALRGKVAVVAGGSRGAGRGIALALGDAGATVYVAGRTTRDGPPPADGAPGTIDETAADVTARGGHGIAVRTDCTRESDVAALYARLERDHDSVDILANAVWGTADAMTSTEAVFEAWGKPFWELPASYWHHHMNASAGAYYLMSSYAMRAMAPRKRGLIIGVTDGLMDGVSEDVLAGRSSGDYSGQLLWDLAHVTINRLMFSMSVEAKKHRIAVLTLMPGFMRTERVARVMTSDEIRKQFRYDLSESTEFIGRAVVALGADKKALNKAGRIHFVADLAREYGFTDVDGAQPPRFNPFAGAAA